MWEELEKVFEELGLPYFRQGSLAEGETLPDTFITFWNGETPEGEFYDNEAHRVVWTWAISFYTKDAGLIYRLPEEFLKIAKKYKFIPQGRAYDLASGMVDFFARFVKIKFMEE